MRRFFAFCALLIVLPSLTLAQGTNEDFERAASFDQRFRNLIQQETIEPQRINNQGNFWFKSSDEKGIKTFHLVNPSKKEKSPLFDHDLLRTSLLELKAPQEAVTKLDLEQLKVDETTGKVLFFLRGQAYEASTKPWELKKVNKEMEVLAPIQSIPKTSPKQGVETNLTFENKLDEAIEIFWLSSAGAKVSYGKIKPGANRAQHTFEHHIWIIQDSTGKVHSAYKAQAAKGIVRITKNTPAPQPQKKQERGNNRPPNSSPDGNWQIIFRDSNIFIKGLNPPRDEIKLTSDGSAKNGYRGAIHWAPDSASFVALKTSQGDGRIIHLIESTPKDQLQPRLISFNYDKPGDKLDQHFPHLFDIKTMREIPLDQSLFNNPWSINNIRWKADSSRFTFLYNQRGHQVLRVVAIDSRSGKASTLVEEISKTFVDYNHKTYFHWLKDDADFIWMSERDGWNHLYLVDGAKGGIKKQLTKGEWVVRNVERVDEDKKQILLKVLGIHANMDPYFSHFAMLNLETNKLTPLTQSEGTHRNIQIIEPDYFLTTWSRVNQPPITELRDLKTGNLVMTLHTTDDSKLKAAGWPAPTPFTAKGRDGKTDIFGIVLKPSNFDPGKKYPVIEQIYAGPHDFHVPKDFRISSRAQSMAELGFIVVQIDGMGTSWRSKAFHDICWKNLADAGFPDRILWMKAAAKTIPQMNLEKVGIYGGSAGGQNAMRALIDHGDFYKAAAADCGCHDNRMDKVWWNELWMGWPVDASYEKSSNTVHAGKIQGKLLLTVGELDRNVDPATTMQVADALIKAKKDFELIVVPGGGHGSGESPYAHRRRQEFFLKHLWGKTP
ncbi:MAG: Prolyl tripeptidyl peptidase precursor [Planctomycetota bacterium]|jgi:dipeptidyl aminopeptidase/acylaminoacyl peptidase